MRNFNPESKEGFPYHTREFITETKKILDKVFPLPKEGAKVDSFEAAGENLNRMLAERCAVLILSETSPEERNVLENMKLDLPNLIKLAIEKTRLEKKEQEEVEDILKGISPKDVASQSKMVDKLNLLKRDSPISRFGDRVYEQIKQKPEAIEALTRLIRERNMRA